MSNLTELCYQTETKESDWEEINGVPTGVGIERWFKNKNSGKEYYCCDDQGEIVVSLCK